MTDTTAADPEPGEQKAAVDIANLCAQQLRRTGYDFVIVGVAKLIRRADGRMSLPGATLFEASPGCAPAYPSLAHNLRVLTDQLDAAFEASGACEAPEGYAHRSRG
jgi:hypothetical protein